MACVVINEVRTNQDAGTLLQDLRESYAGSWLVDEHVPANEHRKGTFCLVAGKTYVLKQPGKLVSYSCQILRIAPALYLCLLFYQPIFICFFNVLQLYFYECVG
jgi:hypothetical protein